MASFLKASCASKRTKTAHEHFEALLGSTEDLNRRDAFRRLDEVVRRMLPCFFLIAFLVDVSKGSSCWDHEAGHILLGRVCTPCFRCPPAKFVA